MWNGSRSGRNSTSLADFGQIIGGNVSIIPVLLQTGNCGSIGVRGSHVLVLLQASSKARGWVGSFSSFAQGQATHQTADDRCGGNTNAETYLC